MKEGELYIGMGGLGILLTAFGSFCIHGCLGANPIPILNLPVAMWGLIGYTALMVWTITRKNLNNLLLLLTSLFFLFAFTLETAAAIGISVGSGFFCPFCAINWVLNIFIILFLTLDTAEGIVYRHVSS